METSLVCISGVRGYEKDGVAYLHIEDVARGLGFTEQKDGVEYVRWRTVDSHLSNLSFATSCESANPHDYYIPENIFYRLCMKAKNEIAEAFQAKVADEIIPSIRRKGSYSANPVVPQTYLEALKALVASEEAKEAALKALTAEKKAHEQDNRDFQAYTDILNKEKMQISSKREAEAMGRLRDIRYREQDLQASVKMTAYGHPSRNKKFTTQNVMETVWFQQTFRASTSETYFNGNPAWKPEVRALKALLTKRANERASIDLENRFHYILTKTKAKTVLKLWMRAKEGGKPFHEAMHEISLDEYTNDIACALSSMVELHDKYEYRRSNGDSAYGMVYSYCYDIWARVLMSLGTREVADYLRDGIDIEEFANTIYSVQSECFGLHE